MTEVGRAVPLVATNPPSYFGPVANGHSSRGSRFEVGARRNSRPKQNQFRCLCIAGGLPCRSHAGKSKLFGSPPETSRPGSSVSKSGVDYVWHSVDFPDLVNGNLSNNLLGHL